MKRLFIFSIMVVALSISSDKVFAGNNAVKGLIIGGGAGAIAGQVIGGTAQSVLIGAAVGSTVGLVIGNEIHHGSHQRRHRPQVVYKPVRNHYTPVHYVPVYKKHHRAKHYKKHKRIIVVKRPQGHRWARY